MCSIDTGDFDPCKVWRETRRRARKAHTCSSCATQINPGDTYVRHFSVFDGYAHDCAVCALCDDARSEFRAAHGTVLGPEYTMEMFQECVSDLSWGTFTLEQRRRRTARLTDDDRRWRTLLAGMKRRYRGSASWTKHLRDLFAGRRRA